MNEADSWTIHLKYSASRFIDFTIQFHRSQYNNASLWALKNTVHPREPSTLLSIYDGPVDDSNYEKFHQFSCVLESGQWALMVWGHYEEPNCTLSKKLRNADCNWFFYRFDIGLCQTISFKTFVPVASNIIVRICVTNLKHQSAHFNNLWLLCGFRSYYL